jgi:hypothetical protein
MELLFPNFIPPNPTFRASMGGVSGGGGEGGASIPNMLHSNT